MRGVGGRVWTRVSGDVWYGEECRMMEWGIMQGKRMQDAGWRDVGCTYVGCKVGVIRMSEV